MFRKRISIVAVFVVAALCVTALGQQIKDPKQIISKARERLLGLESYSYTIYKEGWDFEMEKTAEATKDVAGDAKSNPIAGKYADKVGEVDASKPKWMTYDSDYKFMKPYLVQMTINKSDYVPSMLQGATMTYRPDKIKKGNYFYVKPKISPIGIKRGTETVSGNFFYSTWYINYMKLDMLVKQFPPKLEGTKKIEGRDAYQIVFAIPKGKKIETYPVDYNAWGIPEPIQWRFKDEIGEFSRGNISKIIYFFDVKTLDLVCTDVYQANGEVYYHRVWRNIKVNNLTKDDF
jgi:hypothetical protein